MTDPIAKAIAESREREAKATKGPWYYAGYDRVSTVRPEDVAAEKYRERICEFPLYSFPTKEYHLQPDRRANGSFIAAARTWEPRFRDALEDAVTAIRQIAMLGEDDIMREDARALLARIGEILSPKSGAPAKIVADSPAPKEGEP